MKEIYTLMDCKPGRLYKRTYVELHHSDSEEKNKNETVKNTKTPLIQPPKMTPPPPPKIETTQMPLSSDVLIKLRKKVK